MSKHVWYAITSFGDASLGLPCALLVAFVLLVPATTRRLAFVWLAIVVAGETIVAATKVMYMGWHLGIPSLDFIGLSGHTTLSFMVWPVTFALVLGRTDRWRAIGAAVGIVFALLIAFSRLKIHVHSLSEVVLGAFLGITLSSFFLLRYRRRLDPVALPRWLFLIFILPFVFGYGRVAPTESILAAVARTLSGHSHVYTRADLHTAVHERPGAP